MQSRVTLKDWPTFLDKVDSLPSMGSRLVMDDDHHGLIAFSFLKLSLS